jgi:hypothetical protein
MSPADKRNKPRRIAAAVFAAAAVLFTLVGLNRSVSRQAAKTSALFYAQFGISEQLSNRQNAARGLASLAAEDSALSADAETLRSAVNALYDASSVHGKFAANTALESAWQTLYDAMQAKGLDADTQTKADYYVNILRNAQRNIDGDGYNDAVASFETDVLGTVPSRLLRPFLFTDAPEAFA